MVKIVPRIEIRIELLLLNAGVNCLIKVPLFAALFESYFDPPRYDQSQHFGIIHHQMKSTNYREHIDILFEKIAKLSGLVEPRTPKNAVLNKMFTNLIDSISIIFEDLHTLSSELKTTKHSTRTRGLFKSLLVKLYAACPLGDVEQFFLILELVGVAMGGYLDEIENLNKQHNKFIESLLVLEKRINSLSEDVDKLVNAVQKEDNRSESDPYLQLNVWELDGFMIKKCEYYIPNLTDPLTNSEPFDILQCFDDASKTYLCILDDDSIANVYCHAIYFLDRPNVKVLYDKRVSSELPESMEEFANKIICKNSFEVDRVKLKAKNREKCGSKFLITERIDYGFVYTEFYLPVKKSFKKSPTIKSRLRYELEIHELEEYMKEKAESVQKWESNCLEMLCKEHEDMSKEELSGWLLFEIYRLSREEVFEPFHHDLRVLVDSSPYIQIISLREGGELLRYFQDRKTILHDTIEEDDEKET